MSASLKDSAPGGFLDDMDATCINAETGEYTYPSGTSVNAMILTFRTDDGQEHIEAYSSGGALPSPNHTGFETTPRDNSKAKRFIVAAIKVGVDVEDSVKAFENQRFHLKRETLPKMPGIDKEGDKDKTVLLPTALLKSTARPTAKAPVKSAPAVAKPATSAASTASATSATNGDLDADAIIAVQAVLAGAPNGTTTVPRLGTALLMALAKEKHPHAQAIRKLATADWLIANSEVGSWVIDGQNVTLA